MLSMSASGTDPRLALALLCALAIAHSHEKRADSESIVSPVPFTFAARYGRSSERFITPRNDRWMMTARYGKRSDSFTEEDPLQEVIPTLKNMEGREGKKLSCEYTGVLQLYRCTRMRERVPLARKSDVDPAPSEEI